MDDLIKKANDIVEDANKSNRKEDAFGCLSTGVALAGLMMGASDGEDRVKGIDSMMHATIELLNKNGFAVRGKPKEFEAKFKMLQLRLLVEAKADEDVKRILQEGFDEYIWNICLFDERVEV